MLPSVPLNLHILELHKPNLGGIGEAPIAFPNRRPPQDFAAVRRPKQFATATQTAGFDASESAGSVVSMVFIATTAAETPGISQARGPFLGPHLRGRFALVAEHRNVDPQRPDCRTGPTPCGTRR